MNCPVCGAARVRTTQILWDDRFGYPGQFKLMNCQNCGHVFLDCNFTPDQLGELYTCYYPRRNLDATQYKPHAEAKGLSAWFNGLNSSAFRYVPRNVRVLDVGCGFGQSLGYHEARGCEVYGVEADENIRRVADKFGFKVYVGLFDDSLYKAEFFDCVTMDQVIEHVTDPVATLRGVARILKPGGTAVLSTPNASGWGARCFGRRWINWHAPYHLQFFTPRSMKMAGEQVGLVVERTMTITSSAWLNFQWLHLLTYPPEGKPSIFWAPNGAWSGTKKLALKALTIIHRCKIDHIITRMFDMLGVGDNRVFLFRKP